MRTPLGTKLTTSVAILALAGCGSGSGGGAYPSKPVQVIVPGSPGGAIDAATRAIAPCLGTELDGRVSVINKAGAAPIGIGQVVRSKPDGFTLMGAATGTVYLSPIVNDGVDYKSEDAEVLAIMSEVPVGIFAKGDSGITAEDVVSGGETYSIGTPGPDTEMHIGVEYLAQQGAGLTPVPFAGVPESITALLGGSTDLTIAVANQATIQLVESGDIELVAAMQPEPIAYLPDAPTTTDLGWDLPDLSVVFALMGPKDLPSEVTDAVKESVESCLGNEDVIQAYGGEDFLPEEQWSEDEIAERRDATLELFEKSRG